MGSTEVDDMEALLAQMDKEYEEAENKKKTEKKGKKKGGKQAEEVESKDTVSKETEIEKENISTAKDKDKDKDKKKGKKKDTNNKEKEESVEKPKEDVLVETQTKKPEPEKEKEKEETKKDKKKKTDKKPAETVAPKPVEEVKPVEPEKETKAEAESKKDDKKKGKKPTGPSKLIKEALQKQKDAEEKIRREEEEKARKEEELRLKILEEERREKERREKKKQKEKERIKRKKEEGTYLTKAQKEEKERAMRQLEALGVVIPAKTEAEAVAEEKPKSKPKYEKLKKHKPQTQTTKEEEEEAKELNGEMAKVTLEQTTQVEVVHEIKDNWDEESDGEEKKKSLEKGQVPGGESSGDEEESENEDEEESSEESESESESESDDDISPIERVKKRLMKRHIEAEKERSTDNLRAPVICVLGHVDTGKTKLLDNLRRTRVQEDEAGGITQQIGATNVPLETITERTRMCRHVYKNQIKLPGLLIIDTPGHESFKSLRSRGSSLCDIAILVVDIMHGLEPQTIESLKLLVDKETKFIVALNKVDRLFEWKTFPNLDIIEALNRQQQNTKFEFEKRSKDIIVQFAEQGVNAALYYQNPDPNDYVSIVPTSAHSSDGTGNLIALIIETCQTVLAKRLSFSNELNCTVLEVKVIPSLGTTIDVCLVNGKLNVCDTIIVPGQEGPIVTQIRGLLKPAPNRDLRTKNSYIPNKELFGACGVKIAAKGLEKAMPGLPLFVARKDDEIDYYKDELQRLLRHALSAIKLSDVGVFVQASTLGSLEALLDFLKTSKVPYTGINIGPIHKKDVTKASIMLEKDAQWAVILAFDVRVEREAQDLADHLGVKIFTADIIYHLFDKFIGYREELKRKKKEEFKDVAVFPCKLKIMPEFIFNKRDPIVIGVRVEAGFVKMGTPIVALCEDTTENRESQEKFVDLGRVTSIEFNHKPLEVAKTGQEVCIKIDNTTGGAPKLLGRHFTEKDPLISKISRESIDAVKDYFREEMSKPDWELIINLKKLFQII